ncbi:hypothetical protein C8Q80DRAFT_1273710 [Daedaleopsis nitida]|nr:hypothetical protein C8Q80DRAFT_1273710 [Daedaleopsis nitida]
MPSDATEAALGLLGLTAAFSPSSSTVPAKRKQPATDDDNPATTANSEPIDCICGLSYDDGSLAICCDSCSRWCHASCFNIVENEVPDEWRCWLCEPRPLDDKDKDRPAKQHHKPRQRQGSSTLAKRRASPGVERKPNKRKRRASINVAAHPHPHPQPHEDEHVDIDEPWTSSYVPITKDVPTDDARERLRRVACDWRGVSAISPAPTALTPGCTTPALLTPDAISRVSPIALQQVPKPAAAFPSLLTNGNPSVRPPSYAIHATEPIPSSKFIAPYPSTIIPTATYLRDPLNAYAHLGMPKPFVHLFGPPLDVALDARTTGDHSRYVRSGCRPNAILRPIFCPTNAKDSKAEDDAIKFGIFALRDLKANEEVVLGWEWDDGNVVHHLPALIHSPFEYPPHQIHHFRAQMTSMLHTLSSTFTTCACGANARDCVLSRIAEFVENQTPLTPSPSPPSQFTKEKHGGKANSKSEKGDQSPVDLGPLIGIERGFRTRERIPFSGGMGGVELVPHSLSEPGPSRLASGCRKVSFPDDLLTPTSKAKRANDRKGKGRAEEVEEDEEGQQRARPRARRHSADSTAPVEVDVPTAPEARLPPKLRKTWIAKSAERLRERKDHMRDSDTDMDAHSPAVSDTSSRGRKRSEESYLDPRDMPPPPVPPTRTPPLALSPAVQLHAPPLSASSSSSSTASSSAKPRLATDSQMSPSIPFSKLSLLSPVVPTSINTSTSSPVTPSFPSASTSTSLPASTSTPSASKAGSKSKPRRPTLSPQPPASDSEKPAKPSKARTKGKEKTSGKGKTKEKTESTAAKKSARPRPGTPTTEPGEHRLEPSLLGSEVAVRSRKGKEKEKESSRSPAVVTKALASPSPSSPAVVARTLSSSTRTSTPASPPPPPCTPVVITPELPPEPPDDDVKPDISVNATPTPTVVAENPPSAQPSETDADAMQVDECPPSPPSSSGLAVLAFVALDARRDSSTPPVPPADVVLLESTESASDSRTAPALDDASSAVQPESEPMDVDDPQPAATPNQLEVIREPPSSAAPPQVEVAPLESPSVASAQLPSDVPSYPHHPTPPAPPSAPYPTAVESDLHGSAPAPAKVKLSLKDFARRKREQREKEKDRPQVKEATPGVLDETGDVLESGVREGEEGVVSSGESPAVAAGLEKEEEGPAQDGETAGEDARVVEQVEPLADGEAVDSDRDGGVSMAPFTDTAVASAPRVDVKAAEEPSTTPEHVPDTAIATVPATNGHAGSCSPVRPSSNRALSPIATPAQSLKAKIELVDSGVPNTVVVSSLERSRPPSPISTRPPSPISKPPPSPLTPSPPPHASPKISSATRTPLAPQPSQEDGEIFSPPPPKAPPLAPRSHTPPTHPRSFYAGNTSPTRRSPPLSGRQPLHPARYARNSGPARGVPSAPRALRESGVYSSSLGLGLGLAYASPGGQNAPYFAPRGPSADRERERERERERDRDRDRERLWGRERERDGPSERAWIPGPSRGRGRGTWGR